MSVSITSNYGLKKPDGYEEIKPNDFNYNADIIHTELFRNSLLIGTAAPTNSTAASRVGQIFYNATTKNYYKSTAVSGIVFSWEPTLPPCAWSLIQTYAIAGSFTGTAPDLYGNGLPYDIYVLIDGGGGSGNAAIGIGTHSY